MGVDSEDRIYSWDSHEREYVPRLSGEFEGYQAVADIIREKEYVVINDTSKEKDEPQVAEFFSYHGITALIGCRVKLEMMLKSIFFLQTQMHQDAGPITKDVYLSKLVIFWHCLEK